MPFALPVTPLVAAPLLASALTAATPAAVPLPSSDFVPFQAPKGAGPKVDQAIDVELGPVQTFDPVARAQVIATELPRQWRGTYQAFGGSAAVPVQLSLASVTAVGGMVDLRGHLSIGGMQTPVQGNVVYIGTDGGGGQSGGLPHGLAHRQRRSAGSGLPPQRRAARAEYRGPVLHGSQLADRSGAVRRFQ